MPNNLLDARVESLEKDNEQIKKLLKNLEPLPDLVHGLKKSVDEGHFCKWNGTIGSLITFQQGASDINQRVFRRIDNHEENLEEIIKAITELSTGRKIMETIADEQEQSKKDQKIYNRDLRKSIFTLVLVIILTFMFNVFFEVIRNYYI